MSPKPFDRQTALELLYKHTKNEGLRKHALAVEAVMRRFAQHFDEVDRENVWALAGLLHDMDWEETKQQFEKHSLLAAKYLSDAGASQEVIDAVKIHNYAHGITPTTPLEKVLYYVEELTGIVTALALVHPQGIDGVKTSSVIKKLKNKSFAAGVNREIVYAGPAVLNMTLEAIVDLVIEAMRGIKTELGLTKTPA
ncbi:MAG: hypothetical protein UY09_C0017G0011 [Parcubacteria group bacterium GW2011_GWA2_47_8]|nr:MAG: hypothetical protein UY09_C0017G0011 [Parcubacteria group bacterium GW2011_GWA2_47_8]OHB20803.1 MAG: hypothetical protein A2666_04295 [Parcubacteria group bacterium RIFCSPHIGHO2_01_FULL_47_10b]